MTDRKRERRGLGRGLSALMADVGLDPLGTEDVERDGSATVNPGLREIEIEKIHANPDQPRRHFEEQALAELAESIRNKGVLQPLVVRPSPRSNGDFEIVAGERRWRAAQVARLASVPALVRELTDSETLEIAIVENIQREELNAIEEAASYRQLVERFGHTQERIAEALGKSRSHIANLLRLLTLPESIQNMVSSGTLSAGHARALITAENPEDLARRVVGQGLSVRETEELARKVSKGAQSGKRKSPAKDADTRVLEDDLSANLGMSVVIDHRAGGEGQLTIRYKTIDQLDQLCQILSSVR